MKPEKIHIDGFIINVSKAQDTFSGNQFLASLDSTERPNDQGIAFHTTLIATVSEGETIYGAARNCVNKIQEGMWKLILSIEDNKGKKQ